ncbi:hypothetical protein HK104_004770, partial [Borealophlyctis nickersoniae]
MSASVVAKISYAGILRQIVLGDNTPTWATFEAQIRQAHNIPAGAPIAVTYIDSDNDVIVIDTDAEIGDLLRQVRAEGVRSLKFHVAPRDPDTASYIVVGQQTPQATAAQSNDGERGITPTSEPTAMDITPPAPETTEPTAEQQADSTYTPIYPDV